MAPGDLNLKKSWNPKLMKNQQKVWQKEQEALAERKKIKERQREIEAEREKEELRRLRQQRANNGQPVVSDRIDWMYEHGKTEESVGKDEISKEETENDKEDYLLGKKRLDGLIMKNDGPDGSVKQTSRHNRLENTLHVGNIHNNMALPDQKELVKISKDDPMAKIKMMQLKKQNQSQLQNQNQNSNNKHARSRSSVHENDHKRSRNSDRHHGSSHKSSRDSDRHYGSHHKSSRDSDRHHGSSHKSSHKSYRKTSDRLYDERSYNNNEYRSRYRDVSPTRKSGSVLVTETGSVSGRTRRD